MRIVIPLLVAALLCACGQKGNLYLPGQTAEQVGSAPEATPVPAPAPSATPTGGTPAAGAAGIITPEQGPAPAADPAAAERERENAARNRN
jgi:predicted small lipoprotein YifL